MNVFNPTGGLIYHWRAKRHRDSLWVPFRQEISALLAAWQPPEKHLLILGPSGGHTLATDFFKRFETLLLVDPDPLAPFFFRNNHPDLKTKWSRQNLIFKHKQFEPHLLQDWLKEKNIAILFANLLGQLPLIGGSTEMHAWWRALQTDLNQHSWLSYHDLFSFPQFAALPPRLPERPVVPQLVEWSLKSKKPLELTDHATGELFPDSHVSFVWHLTPRRTHVVGGVSHTISRLVTK